MAEVLNLLALLVQILNLLALLVQRLSEWTTIIFFQVAIKTHSFVQTLTQQQDGGTEVVCANADVC
jgi:hypothetical protein